MIKAIVSCRSIFVWTATVTAVAARFFLDTVEAFHHVVRHNPHHHCHPDTAIRRGTATSLYESGSGAKKKTPASSLSSSSPHLIFPGGGIYFFWQAGVVTFLRENGYHLHHHHHPSTATTDGCGAGGSMMTGASAGALTATLAATGVDFYEAMELALWLADRSNVWRRTGGLQGIWGHLIYEWLDALIPDTAVEAWQQPRHTLTLLVTPFPNVWDPKLRVHSFHDKQDLIAANMASIHLPWFLNSQLTATFRGRSVLDGSFLARVEDYYYGVDDDDNQNQAGVVVANEKVENHQQQYHRNNSVLIDYKMDPLYRNQSLLSFIETVEPFKIRQMFEDGKRYARRLEQQGYFTSLYKSWPTSNDA